MESKLATVDPVTTQIEATRRNRRRIRWLFVAIAAVIIAGVGFVLAVPYRNFWRSNLNLVHELQKRSNEKTFLRMDDLDQYFVGNRVKLFETNPDGTRTVIYDWWCPRGRLRFRFVPEPNSTDPNPIVQLVEGDIDPLNARIMRGMNWLMGIE